jgi:hypothetical protein
MRFNSWLQFFSNDIGSVGHEHPYSPHTFGSLRAHGGGPCNG